jgi:hypothetical protein
VPQAPKEHKDLLVLLERLELPDLKALPESQDRLVLKDYKDHLGSLGLPALLVHKEHKDHQVSLVSRVPQDLRERKVFRALPESLGLLEALDLRVLRDRLVSQD